MTQRSKSDTDPRGECRMIDSVDTDPRGECRMIDSVAAVKLVLASRELRADTGRLLRMIDWLLEPWNYEGGPAAVRAFVASIREVPR